jgi:hypothetical protein
LAQNPDFTHCHWDRGFERYRLFATVSVPIFDVVQRKAAQTSGGMGC